HRGEPRCAACQNYVRRLPDQFCRIGFECRIAARGEAVVDSDILPFDPTESTNAFPRAATLARAVGSFSTRSLSTPTRRVRWGCCARPASGHVTAAPLRTAMNSRRLTR